MNIFDVNWLAVLLSALSGFVIGGLWYGPLFGRAWAAEAGLSEEDKNGANMPTIFGLSFVLLFFSAWVLAHVFATYGPLSFEVIVLSALGVGLGFIVPAIGVNYLFRRDSLKLFLIDGGYWTLVYTAMGVIFGVLG